MRQFVILIVGLLYLGTNAQNINDVIRYSIEENQGTARFQAMGGAFGALGGDLSAIGTNPAGSSVFAHTQFAVTGSNYHRNNSALYGNLTVGNELNSQELNQAGGVFVFKSSSSPWKKLALAFNYGLAENFDNEFAARGITNEGIDNYFLNFANGIEVGLLKVQTDRGERIDDAYLNIGEDASLGYGGQQAFLGFQAGIIDPVTDNDDNETAYRSLAGSGSVNQDYLQRTTGYNSKFAANFSGQYQENLFLGASLNFHSVVYERYSQFTETGHTTDNLNTIEFDNLLLTEGDGFSFTLGAIAKLNDNVRIGGSYQSPTWYRFTDNISQRIRTDATVKNPDLALLDFNLVNIFEEYKIKTPGKISGSAAIIFGKDGLLSFDYGYQDFSEAELRPTSSSAFAEENTRIANTLGVTNSYRFGGEYRIERFSLRGGYRIEESPYNNPNLMDDLEGYSAGIGYDFGGSRLDIAYARTEQNMNELFFDAGANNNATINRVNTNVALTYTVKF